MSVNPRNIERLGLVYRPTGTAWHRTHCQNPFAQRISEDRWRVHFAVRDEKNRSQGGWCELEAGPAGFRIERAASAPSLTFGRAGAFDDAGAMPGSLVEHDGRLLLYYTGWTLGRTVPFFFFIGLAESTDGGETFRRLSEAPVLGRNRHDPFLTGAPCVLKERDRFRMWYISGTEWVVDENGATPPVHYYTIKHATSTDGVIWETNNRLCLPYLESEHAIARPMVTLRDGRYSMLYSARRLGETYRVYTAVSKDGLDWTREPDPVINIEGSDWESEMVCYASELNTRADEFLLYNGNAYGKDGFGACRLR